MRGIKMYPEDALITYGNQDKRDAYTVNQRVEALRRLEEEHRASVDAGGPDYVQENGYPWVDYGGRGGQALKRMHCAQVVLLRERYGSDLTLFSGPRGSGKTLLAVVMALRFYRIGYMCISNFGVDFGHRLEGATDLLGIIRSHHNTMWLLDEVHQLLSKWAQQSAFQREAVGGIAALRKQLSGGLFVTSQEGDIGIDVKRELRWFIYPYQPRIPYVVSRAPGFLRTRARVVGPRPIRGTTLAEKWDIAIVQPEPARQTRWRPSYDELYLAAACYGSFHSLPPRKLSGNITAANVRAMDLDRPIQLVDSIEFDDPEDATATDAGTGTGQPNTMEDWLAMLVTDLLDAGADDDSDKLDINWTLTRMEQQMGMPKYSRHHVRHYMQQYFGSNSRSVDAGRLREWLDRQQMP